MPALLCLLLLVCLPLQLMALRPVADMHLHYK